jgi:hypothetical protein
MMKRYEDEHVRVTLSDEGLRRAYGDNTLLRRAKFRDTARLWVIAFAIALGWGAFVGMSK